ncbi:hypothetical protein [Klebsiella pneumoniae IS43]|uniref:Uncharacterized protein n=1 Tax=Klebsiella pneumoniae IS43 TaxID=1432552 RepID=W1DL11_KLEPN|nr:hypothetical protein [Klebsiella pneumoniae IS43]
MYRQAVKKRQYVTPITSKCFLMLPKARLFAIVSDIEHL